MSELVDGRQINQLTDSKNPIDFNILKLIINL